jgi:adenosylcobyric acid synthase
MMGELIEDPYHVESDVKQVKGLGLLPVRTVLQEHKTTLQCSFTYKKSAENCKGYEIHMGHTSAPLHQPLTYLADGRTDGFILNDKCWGTYLHGILDNTVVINDLLTEHTGIAGEDLDYQLYKEEQYNRLADLIRAHVDMEKVYNSLKN